MKAKYDNSPFTLNDKSIVIPTNDALEAVVLGIMLNSAEAGRGRSNSFKRRIFSKC